MKKALAIAGILALSIIPNPSFSKRLRCSECRPGRVSAVLTVPGGASLMTGQNGPGVHVLVND